MKILAWASLAIAALVLVLDLGVFSPRVLRQLDPKDLTPAPAGGHAFLLLEDIPGEDTALEGLSTLEVLEDGTKLGPAHTPGALVIALGGGRFNHWRGCVCLSASDSSDPRTNGHRYALRYDGRPSRVVTTLVLVLAGVLNFRRVGRALERLETLHPAWPTLAIVLLTLVYRVAVAARFGDQTFGGFAIKGVPFSDAQGWDALARQFASGERTDSAWIGWGGLRPFYYVFMGSVFALTGPALSVTRVVHVLMAVLGAGFVFDLLRRLAATPVALLGALAQAFLFYDARASLLTATEPLGQFLTILSLWALVLGVERLVKGEPRAAPILFASGSLLAFANLARPLNLLAAFAAPPALLFVLWRHGRLGASRARALLAGLALLTGFALTLAPWILRQHAVYGIWTISSNTSEMMYAATSPELGTWDPKVAALTSAPSIGERAAFFEEGTRHNLREHLGWYVGHVAQYVLSLVSDLQAPRWFTYCTLWLLLLSGLSGLSGSRRPVARLVLLALALAALTVFLPWGTHLWVLGVALAIFSGHPLTLVAGFLVPTILSLGVVATRSARFTTSLDWNVAAFEAFFLVQAFSLARDGSLTKSRWTEGVNEFARPWGRAARPLLWAAGIVALLLGLGFVRAVLASRNPPPTLETTVPPEEAARWIERSLAASGGIYESVRSKLSVERARAESDYVMAFAAKEGNDLSPALAARSYAFTAFVTKPRGTHVYAIFPGALPESLNPGEPLVLIGVRLRRGDAEVLEVIALGRSEDRLVLPDAAAGLAQVADLRALLSVK